MRDPEGYKTRLSGVFSRASPEYDRVGPRFFTHFGKKLVDFAGITPGARVLDVACGRGAVLVPASAAVSSGGHVIGIDLAEGMVEQTRAELVLHGLANTTVLRMDAENLEFPDATFDFVLCGFCLFFFPHLEQALAGFMRVLKPGGWLALSTFEAYEDRRTKRWDELNRSFRDCLKPVAMAEVKELDSEAEIRQVLSEAGYAEIDVTREQASFQYGSEDEWWQAAWSTGFRGFLERMEPDVLARYMEQAGELIRAEKTEEGIPREWRLLFSKAQKPF